MSTLVMVLLVAVVVAVGVALVRRQRALTAPAATPSLTPADEQRELHGDVRRLAPGDVVNYEATDFVVEKTIVFDEDGFEWSEHLLAESVTDRRIWLSVEDDDGLEVAIWEKVRGAALEPGAPEIAHGGVSYRRDEQGRARWRSVTPAGPSESGHMEYADYVAGEQLLGFERFGTGGWEVATGRVISEHALDIYPSR